MMTCTKCLALLVLVSPALWAADPQPHTAAQPSAYSTNIIGSRELPQSLSLVGWQDALDSTLEPDLRVHQELTGLTEPIDQRLIHEEVVWRQEMKAIKNTTQSQEK